MDQNDKKEIIEAVEKTIDKVVNGKIDALHKKIDLHIKEIDPFLTGWKGAQIVGNTLKWIAGVIIAVAAVVAVVTRV